MSQSIRSFAIQPDAASESYWQPIPANGFVEVHVSRHRTSTNAAFESGTQTVAPSSFVRAHAHAEHEELILVYEGQGIADIEGEPHPMQPGTTLYLAAQEKHKFTNTGDSPLRFFWVLMPGGLSDFFKAIGQVRHAGDEAPEPFPRPENVAQIEADTVFARTE